MAIPSRVFLDTNVYIGVYLTAKFGKADCFISSNQLMIRAIAGETGEFECLKPEDFLRRYLESGS